MPTNRKLIRNLHKGVKTKGVKPVSESRVTEHIVRLRIRLDAVNHHVRAQMGSPDTWYWPGIFAGQKLIIGDTESVVCLESPSVRRQKKHEVLNAKARKQAKANALQRRRQLAATTVAAEGYALITSGDSESPQLPPITNQQPTTNEYEKR